MAVLEVNLVEKQSRLYTPRTYVVCNIVGSKEFYKTKTGDRDLRQVLNGSLHLYAPFFVLLLSFLSIRLGF